MHVLGYFLRIFFILFITLSFSNAQDYIWPTDASNAMTSSFAESRPGRFHAGIDVKTWGQVGFHIFAVRNGHVSRIRVSPFGYGRAIYLTLDTGEVVVYGHLQRFNDEIEAYVETQQQKRNMYSLDLYPSESRFVYLKGDTLGLTGQTGIGYPHLHFEFRDTAGRPMNPFLKGYTVNDKVRPTVSRISVMPLDALSTVNGDWRPIRLSPTHLGGGKYRVTTPIKVTGRIALGVSAYDRMTDITNKFGVYINELYVDERLVFKSRYDRYSYAVNYHAKLDRDYRFLMEGKGYFYNLFVDEGNKLPFYNGYKPFTGVLDFGDLYEDASMQHRRRHPIGIPQSASNVFTELSGGEHRFKMLLKDYWGNSAEISGMLLRDEQFAGKFAAQKANQKSYVDLPSIKINAEYYDRYVRLEFQMPTLTTNPPDIYGVHDDGVRKKMPLVAVNGTKYITAWSLKNSDVGPLTIEMEYPDSGATVVSHKTWLLFKTVKNGERKSLYTQDGQCKIDFSKNSLFKDIFVRTLTKEKLSGTSYEMVSDLYVIEPDDVPLDGGVNVAINYPQGDPAPEKLGLYLRYGNGAVEFRGNKRSGHAISGKVKSLGRYCLIRDEKPPEIRYLYPSQNMRLASKTPTFKAVFRDGLSGISGENNMKMLLDGKKVIAVYDPEKNLLQYKVRSPLEAGKHVVSLVLRDRCGNENRADHTFYIN